MTITAAADGSSLGNPGPTGWAWYIDGERWAAGGAPRGTNNIGELTAVAELLDATADAGLAAEPLRILCDSKYVIDSCTKWMRGWKYNGWKKKDGKPVLNIELMQRLDVALQGRTVTFEWVKGHAGHVENEAADERARAVASAYAKGREPDAPLLGPGLGGGADARGGDAAVSRDGGAVPSGDAAVSRDGGAVPLWDAEHDADEIGGIAGADGAADEEALVLERRLAEAMAGTSREALDGLLADEFELVDADGRSWSRDEVLAGVARASGRRGGGGASGSRGLVPGNVAVMRVVAMGAGVRLVRSTSVRDGDRRAHASLWCVAAAGEGRGTGPGGGPGMRQERWRLRFHQVTAISGD